MELSWSRFETHRSPKGHGLRTRARGRTVEAWQDAAGRWRARLTSAPQTTPDFKSWSEARQWAEQRIAANPAPEHRPQRVHRRKNREVTTERGFIYDTETEVELIDAESGDVEAAGTLDEVLATGKIRMPREDVIERLAKRGFVDFRSSLLREVNPRSPMKNPRKPISRADAAKLVSLHKGGSKAYRKQRVVLSDEDGRVQWSGSLDTFLDDNEDLDDNEIIIDLVATGESYFGGGAAPFSTLRLASFDPTADRNPNREMRISNAWATSRGHGAGRGRVVWYKCYEIAQGGKTIGRWCGHVATKPDRYLDFDTGSMWLENDDDRRTVEAAIWQWEATHETVGVGKSDKATNPRGKHIACGTEITAKQCRQLQHVYESQKKRGLSDKRAAQSAWGSLRNPDVSTSELSDDEIYALIDALENQPIGPDGDRYSDADFERLTELVDEMMRRRGMKNPAKGVKGEIDEHAATELELWIDNTRSLHNQWSAIVKNLWKHRAKGRYNHERAVDGFMYLVDAGAKDYTKEFGGKWNEMFDSVTRRYVANEYAKSFENNQRDEIEYAPPGAKQNPKGKNPTARFDALSPKDQVAALRAYGKGLEAGVAGQSIQWTGRMGPFAAAGMNDARVALGGARANNPTPPQGAWVVLEDGKPVGLFFAERPIELADAARVANGPGGRRRNGAGLGAFLGSVVGATVGTLFVALGAIPVATAGGAVIAPLSLLLSMAGGAIGGHVGAPRDRKKRGAIGGGLGGTLGPLGAALGGYLGGRKPDKRRNPARATTCGCKHSRATKLARNLCA